MKRMKFLSLVLVAGLLSACGGGGGIASIIGMDQKSTPDEFAVVKRASLTLPPDFSLRPPDPNGIREQNLEASNQARQAVFGNDAAELKQANELAAKNAGASMAELALLKNTGALEADSSIRSQIDQEMASLSTEEDGFVNDLLFWRKNNAPQGDILDASAEARRIQENASLGVDITTGDTPIIRRATDNPLFSWF